MKIFYNSMYNIQRKQLYLFFTVALLFAFVSYQAIKHSNDTLQPDSLVKLVQLSSNKTQSTSYYDIPMPCIEPYCTVQCLVTYRSDEKNKLVDSRSLTDIEQQHLMIDLGRDKITQELLDFIPPSKICSFYRPTFLYFFSKINTNVQFYPIIFGFVDKYFYKTISQQVFIDNKTQIVEQICLPKKSKDFSDLIPGDHRTYKFSFDNEFDYRRLYSTAYFAITMKKSGWDCNRHYEILSSGTIPFFDQLNQTSKHTLSLLPKSLLYAAQTIPGVDRIRMTIDHRLFDRNQYQLLLHRLLYYTKHRLTTIKIVEYILSTIKYSISSSQNHSILFISHNKSDYMKDFMLHGFTEIFKENLHVFQPPRYLYEYPLWKMWTDKETQEYFQEKLYGFAYGYKLILKDYFHLYERDMKEFSNENIIENNIRNRNYSLIVYGSILREDRYFSLVKQYYNRSRIVLIDGEDEQRRSERIEYAKWGSYFLRELPNDCDLIA